MVIHALPLANQYVQHLLVKGFFIVHGLLVMDFRSKLGSIYPISTTRHKEELKNVIHWPMLNSAIFKCFQQVVPVELNAYTIRLMLA